MIWIDKFDGNARVYVNLGRKDVGGSQFEWRDGGKQYDGAWAGTCQYFPEYDIQSFASSIIDILLSSLDGDGRADLHSIKGTWVNDAETWFNRCGALDYNGDDANWKPGQDPGMGALPAKPTTPPISEKPVEDRWKEINCDATPALTSDSADEETRWNDADANDAWDAATAFYHRVKGDSGYRDMEFTEIIADFFHASPMRKCTDVDNTECSDIVNCGQGSSPNADVNSPAG